MLIVGLRRMGMVGSAAIKSSAIPPSECLARPLAGIVGWRQISTFCFVRHRLENICCTDNISML